MRASLTKVSADGFLHFELVLPIQHCLHRALDSPGDLIDVLRLYARLGSVGVWRSREDGW